jgi:hypothetical protein
MADKNSAHTISYDDHLVLLLVKGTVKYRSQKEQIAYYQVMGALERRISSIVDWSQYLEVGLLGLDEIAL